MFDMFGTEKSRFGIAIQAFRFLGAVNSYVVSSLVLGSDVMSSDKDAGIEETKGPVGAWNATGSPTLNHTKSLSSSLTLGKSLRHEITADLAEPKVLSPHKTRPGNPPRRIEVERKKREYVSFDINAEMTNNGVIEHIRDTRKNCEQTIETIDQYPLSYFDNTEYDSQPAEFWQSLVAEAGESGVVARAMFISPPIPPRPKVIGEKIDSLVRNYRDIFWASCRVVGYNAEKDVFSVFFSAADSFSISHEDTTRDLERIYVCFEAESPRVYCERLSNIVKSKRTHHASISLNLYTDCMPMESLNPLDSESVNRVLERAINTGSLKRNAMLDTSSVLQQYNLNHMRTLNQIIFADMLEKREQDVRSVHSNSYDAALLKSLVSPNTFGKAKDAILTGAEDTIGEKVKAFRFASLTSQGEVNTIMLSIQNEVVGLDKQYFFVYPEKTMRIEEYTMAQGSQASAMTQAVKEGWLNSITNSVRNNLKEIRKGWFNIDETNIDIYNFSKLKKFLMMINMVMESSIRTLMYRRVADYVGMISSFCPTNIVVHSNEKATFEGRESEYPLFNVDLKFVNSSEEEPEAKFVYSVQPGTIKTALMEPFDKAFSLLSGIIKVERRIMKKLFWPNDPKIQIPHIGEEWAQHLRTRLEATIDLALVPMQEYIETLGDLMGLIQIDMDTYVGDAVERCCGGEVLNLAELAKLAVTHEEDAKTVVDLLPSSVTIGLITIDCKTVKTMLSGKHLEISHRLFAALQDKCVEYAMEITREFQEMYDELIVPPADIEGITDVRDYMSGLPQKIDAMGDRITKNDLYFRLLDDAKWKIPVDQMDLHWEVFRWPSKMHKEMANVEKSLRAMENHKQTEMEEEQADFNQDLSVLQGDVAKLKSLTALADAAVNAENVRRIKATIAEYEEKARLFNSREGLFGATTTDYGVIGEQTRLFEPFYDLWDCADKWLSNKETWTNGSFLALDPEAVEAAVGTLLRNLNKSGKTFERLGLSQCNVIAFQVREEVDEFKVKVPIITNLRNPGMRERHWIELVEKTGAVIPEFDKMDAMSLQNLVDMQLVEKMADVEKVAERSSKEFQIEVALNKMQEAWESVELFVELYRETGTCILKGVDDYMALLDEHVTMTQAMALSAFKGPFDERIDMWNSSLQIVSEVIDEWITLQRNWLYLQPIFDSADINKQLPQEGKRFSTVDKYWRSTMALAIKGVMCIKFCDDARLLERFREGNKLLDAVQKGLADYLETKRAGFSRFYFLSNDELLEILSETKDPLRVQPHLRKCFEGIKTVDFQEDLTITGMESPERERIPFVKVVNPVGKNIESWMGEVRDCMIEGVRDNMYHAVIDYTETKRTDWMQKWAGQCVLNGSQVHWTREVEEELDANGNKGAYAYYDKLVQQLTDMVILIRGDISKSARVTVGALAVIDVHARDVQKKMADAGVAKTTDFDWMSQMRYYWGGGDIQEGKGDLEVIMVIAKRMYGYEYLGNSFRLVITPLTDKCYLTLMGALQMTLGGAPAGPAGTGKTETTKDLAKALAKQCVVFNCSDGLDYLAMGKFFKGLASSGAWACFDEFNRINIEVLSVIAQQVIHLQGSVKRGEKRTVFEGTDILVDPEFAVFITMNPGYAGRAELPDNLTALFRPVAMMVPDYGLIGEIMLFSFGYLAGRACAQKMVATFRLCSEQLSSQDHYDYGMRAVKTVITAAGNLKRASPDEIEEALLMRALQDVNIPKFLADDLPLFEGILSDLFPGVQRPAFDYGPLLTALKKCVAKKNLQPVPIFLRKNIELYEMICVRHGLMVVGPTGGGKSSNIRVLCDALTTLKNDGIEGERYERTKIYHLNPKSIKMGQLYGAFDENTHEWQDGILCVLIRMCIRQDDDDLKWMLFDGPVDALWIENMNTVLDDNKKLCLTSGEIIQLSAPMTMMFEPEDLAVASPATVSRCGMIYMEPNSLGYDVLLQSWLATLPEAFAKTNLKQQLFRLFDAFLPSVLPHLRRNFNEPFPTVNNCLVEAMLNMLDTFLDAFIDRDDGSERKTQEDIDTFVDRIDPIFLFSIIWSMCCTVDQRGRAMMDNYIRMEALSQQLKYPVPSEGGHSIYDYLYDHTMGEWRLWIETVDEYKYDPKAEFSELIIPTGDSVCYSHLLDILLLNKKHVLMTGPTGTGKSVNIVRHLQYGLGDKYVPLTLSFSAQTGANQTQDLIDSKCEKRRKGVFGPPAGKQFVIFVDDVNMPMKEEYGAQPPLEILRQWFDNAGWYDRKALEMRKIVDVLFVCACGPPGGGRNDITARFVRHFNVINYVDISDRSLVKIFGTILGNFIGNGFNEELMTVTTGIVKATVDVFNTILSELRPTPAKPHYTFNMRDISKVFQGLLMVDKRRVTDTVGLSRMWLHEIRRVFGDRLISESDKQWLDDTTLRFLEAETPLKKEELFAAKADIVCCDFMVPGADVKVYEEVDLAELQSMVEEYLGEYNAESKQPMNLVIFGDAMMHVIKIARVLRQPSGNALLLGVGGSGRQSLTRLASYISGFKLYQIEISKGYGMVEWRENLKECLLYAGVQNKSITFLFNDTQIVYESMLEDINGILNSGDVPNLYAAEDMDAITTACKPDCAKKKIPPTKLNIFGAYLSRVKSNIHVVLCMSPLGSAFRNRLRKFPSLVNCCTIDWFMEWPEDALQSVAARFVASSNLNIAPDVEPQVIQYFKYMHQSIEATSKEFLAKLRRNYYVTPTSYLELLSTYETTLFAKRKDVGTLRDRLTIGVEKLESTAKAVAELQEQLTAMEPELIKTQADVEVMITQITKDKASAAETRAVVEVEEASATKKAAETKAIADDAQRDLDEALPALAEAVRCLKDLKKSDIDEVKNLGKPPINVVRTIQACCIMFSIKPEMVPDPDTPGKKMKDYFGPGKKILLANANKLLEDMTNYDKDNIPEDVIKGIEPFYNDPTFTPDIIEKSSKACKSMCMWSRAMYKYYQVTLVVEPKKKLLAEAEASLAITMAELKKAQDILEGVMTQIANLEASFNEANAKKEQLVEDVTQCRSRLERAVSLMSGLGGEQVRWTASCKDLNIKFDNLVGDALFAAGAIAYQGVFTPDFRVKVNEEWQAKLAELKIPHSQNCSLRVTLADPVAIRSWTICGLPQDGQSVENGIMMAKSRRYPLLIDPQGQANRYIKNMGKDPSFAPNDLDVIKLSDKNFLRSIENGVRFGKWVLLENIGEALDASLEPLLLQQRFKQGGTEMIKIGDSVIPWNDSFKFFMTTKLPNPHYPPEVCVKVSLINFGITFTGLEDQLLGVVVVEEMPEMEEKKNSLVVSNARMRKELQELEDLILYMLSNSTGNILDDHKLIETLATSKVKSEEITKKVEEAEVTEKQIDESRNMYRPVAYRGSILYFCVSDLCTVDPMYQYSLVWFRNLFVQAIRLADPSDDIKVRLESLNNYFTYYVYTNVCRSLFETHKLIFSFLLTVRILQGDHTIDSMEWQFIISGKCLSTVNLENPSPDWLDGRMWGEFCALSTIPAFAGLAQDVCDNVSAWREIYDSPIPHSATLPQGWGNKTNSFQKLAILRAIRADKVPDGVLDYIKQMLGQRFIEPPPFDLAACYKDSTVLSPLVFVLSKGSDPTKAFIEFAGKMKMDRKVRLLSLGQGQGPKAVRLIEEATQKGNWVCLQNCHLYISWLSELERICENLSADAVHKDYRLWLTSMPCPQFPVSVLQSSVKMTNEPPKGLKANLRNAYFKLNNDTINMTRFPDVYKKLLFGLSFFHAVVQERRIFGPLGWNIPYEFNDTDLDISKGQLELFLDQYDETPWRVLNFLTSYINYGGRVTDYIDLRTIDVIMRDYYNPHILIPGYKFDKDGVFYSIEPDETNPHGSYLEYIDSLPLAADPAVFGMHDNAKIGSANADTFYMFEICLSLQASDGGSGSSERDNLIISTARDIYTMISDHGEFDVEGIGMLYPVVYEESMNTVLIQECIRYNKLITTMLITLPDVLKAMKGLVVMSNELESIANAAAINTVPDLWGKCAYPSLKPLNAWVADLDQRIKFVKEWIEFGVPSVFWISGFYFPQAFLTGSLQNFARKYQFPIDTVSFNFIIKEDRWEDLAKPDDGVYIRGLYLEGARWNMGKKSLDESFPKQLYTEFPVMHLMPEKDRKEVMGGVYRCPVYKILSRRGVLSTTGHSTNFIMWFDCPSLPPDTFDADAEEEGQFMNHTGQADDPRWIRAGVAAFSSLMF
jgi:dynein heavy chain